MSPRKRTFEAPPPRPESMAKPPSRTLLMGEEEKRRMIEAHAARRAPLDRSQVVSLWAGVAICVIAIGAGWAYAMRQTIVNAIQPSFETDIRLQDLPGKVNQVFDEKKNESPILQDVGQAMDQVRQIQAQNGVGDAGIKDVVTEAVKQAVSQSRAQATSTDTAKPELPKGLVSDN